MSPPIRTFPGLARHQKRVPIPYGKDNRKHFQTDIPVGRSGRNLRHGSIQRRFGLACISRLHFLHKSTKFPVIRTECQRIIIHSLLIIFHKSPAIPKHCPLLVFPLTVFATQSLPDCSPNAPWSNCASVFIPSFILFSALRCRSGFF